MTFRHAIEQIAKIVGPDITFRVNAEYWQFSTGNTEFKYNIAIHNPLEIRCEELLSLEECVAWVLNEITRVTPAINDAIDSAKIEEFA